MGAGDIPYVLIKNGESTNGGVARSCRRRPAALADLSRHRRPRRGADEGRRARRRRARGADRDLDRPDRGRDRSAGRRLRALRRSARSLAPSSRFLPHPQRRRRSRCAPGTERDAPAIEPVCGDRAVCQFTNVPLAYSEAAALRLDRAPSRAPARAARRPCSRSSTAPTTACSATPSCCASTGRPASARSATGCCRSARGRGAATRAAALLAGWAFDELGLELVEFDVAPGNAASQRVLARLGAERLPGTVVHQWDGRGWEMLRYVLRETAPLSCRARRRRSWPSCRPRSVASPL